MKILVTGGLGLIGHNVVYRLMQQGHNVTIVDTQTNYGIIPQDEIDYLMSERMKKIHDPSFYNMCISDPCELSKKYNVQKFVYISSSMVYGDFKDDVTENAVCNPQGQYGIMKLAGEWLVKDYSRRGCFNHTIIRPSAVYGPLDVEDRVIAKFMLTAMRGGVLNVNGASETLDFTYVEDAADGIVAAALSDNTNFNTYNITKSHSRTLLDAANLAVKIVGKGSIEVRGKDVDFPSRGALNIDAARKDFGYNPKVDVEEGFERYYEWLSNSPFWSSKTV